MSKSKGNTVSPQEVMEKYSADALRFWAAGSKLGEDLDYQENDLIAGKKFETKLWNASNFVFMNLKDFKPKIASGGGEQFHFSKNKNKEMKLRDKGSEALAGGAVISRPKKLEKIDELFLNKLNDLVKSCTESFEEYEYARAKLDTEKFFWSMFCDNYLEIVKKRIYEGKNGKESAQYTLYTGLLTLLKLISPIMPFITEEIYQQHFKKTEKDKSIHISQWPKWKPSSLAKAKENSKNAAKADNEFDSFIEILTKIRQEKSNAKKSMKAEIILSLDKETMKKLKDLLEDLKDVANAKEIKEGKEFVVEFV